MLTIELPEVGGIVGEGNSCILQDFGEGVPHGFPVGGFGAIEAMLFAPEPFESEGDGAAHFVDLVENFAIFIFALGD